MCKRSTSPARCRSSFRLVTRAWSGSVRRWTVHRRPVPIVVVRHVGGPGEGSFQKDSPTFELRSEVADRPRDLLIDKHLPGSFTGTGLQEWLEEREIDHVTIVGYMTNVCCDTTARQALHLGMGTALLHDAVGVPTMPGIDGKPIDAETLHGAALAPLALIGVDVIPTAEWVASLG